jgi:hypothetical protein
MPLPCRKPRYRAKRLSREKYLRLAFCDGVVEAVKKRYKKQRLRKR